MSSPALPLQKAVYEAVKGLGYVVYDNLPDNPTFPYVLLGDDPLVAYHTKTNAQYIAYCSLHVFSNYKGTKQAKEIMDNLMGAIEAIQLDTGWSIGHRQLFNYRIMGDTVPTVTHGYVQYQLNITQI